MTVSNERNIRGSFGPTIIYDGIVAQNIADVEAMLTRFLHSFDVRGPRGPLRHLVVIESTHLHSFTCPARVATLRRPDPPGPTMRQWPRSARSTRATRTTCSTASWNSTRCISARAVELYSSRYSCELIRLL